MIDRKDIRSVKPWCKKNDVPIYHDSGGYFVLESEFYPAYNRPVIESYKKRYGNKWQAIYERCKNGELLLSLHEEPSITRSHRYQGKSKLAQEIFGSYKK